MTSKDFVQRITKVVHNSSIEGFVSVLNKPHGRRPSAKLVLLSQWYNDLVEEDKARIREIIELSAGHAVFGILAVLDGVRSVREAEEPLGTFELRYVVDDESFLLNDPNGEFLHDIFVDLVPPM